MKKIIVRLGGGIGNQLFKYATARKLSLKLKRSLVIDHQSEFRRDYIYKRDYQLNNFNINAKKANYFELLKPFPRLFRYIKVRYNRLLPLNQKDYIIEDEKNYLYYKKLNKLNTKRKTIYLQGNFQNEKYFKNITKILKKDFQIKSSIDKYNLKFKKIIKGKKNSICLHVRNHHKKIKLQKETFDYYIQAILIMKKKI